MGKEGLKAKARHLKQEYDKLCQGRKELINRVARAEAETAIYKAREVEQGNILVKGTGNLAEELTSSANAIDMALAEIKRSKKKIEQAKKAVDAMTTTKLEASDHELIELLKADTSKDEEIKDLQMRLDATLEALNETNMLKAKVERYEKFGILGTATANRLLPNLPSNWREIPVKRYANYPKAVWVLFTIFFTWFKDEVDRRAYKLPDGETGTKPLSIDGPLEPERPELEATSIVGLEEVQPELPLE